MKDIFNLLINLLKQIMDTFFLFLRLLFERLLKPLWILVFLLIYLIWKNWFSISRTFSKFGIPEYTLVKDYLSIILSWPIVVLALGLIFLFKFSQSIEDFLKNSNLRKAGPLEFEQRQQGPSSKDIEEKAAVGINLTQGQFQQIEQAFQEKETQLANKDEAIKYLLERAELFEFAFLNLNLVYNTKVALMWFYLQTGHASTKENFIALYILPPNIPNPEIEKEAIFNALFVNQLIQQNGNLFEVTDKGKRFLQYLGFNLQQ